MAPEGGKISSGTLALAISNLNHRVRSNGLSSKEILLKRDTFTNAPLNFNDDQIQNFKYAKRLQNHPSSELSKSRGSTKIDDFMISEGDIVHIKNEGTKHHAREFYFVISVNYDRKEAVVQKFCGSQLRGRKYPVKLIELYPAATNFISSNGSNNLGEIDVKNDNSSDLHSDISQEIPSLHRSDRNRKPPDYLETNEIEWISY